MGGGGGGGGGGVGDFLIYYHSHYFLSVSLITCIIIFHIDENKTKLESVQLVCQILSYISFRTKK